MVSGRPPTQTRNQRAEDRGPYLAVHKDHGEHAQRAGAGDRHAEASDHVGSGQAVRRG